VQVRRQVLFRPRRAGASKRNRRHGTTTTRNDDQSSEPDDERNGSAVVGPAAHDAKPDAPVPRKQPAKHVYADDACQPHVEQRARLGNEPLNPADDAELQFLDDEHEQPSNVLNASTAELNSTRK
jgi:hypothetical protein